MRILFIDSTHPSLHEQLSREGFSCDLNFHWTIDDIQNHISTYDGIVIRSRIKLSREIIDKATKLKFIARVGAGMENIDVAYAESKGIKCLCAPEGNRDAVGEHALGMLLSLLNNICRSNKEVREGKWIREGNRGYELSGKTIGIIGYGNMGSAFAKKLGGFEVQVLGYDKYKKGYGNDEVKESSLEQIFEEADVLSMHVPLTEETHYMVNDNFINAFKKSFYFINTARGKIVNTADLVKNIQSGKVKGACLDVLEYESLSFENIDQSKVPAPLKFLLESEKVVLTPHIAGWTYESNEKMAKVLIEKIKKSMNK